MLDLYNALDENQKFEIIKILVDKGLIAILIAIAGLAFSLILERWKLQFKKQEEYAKISLPVIVGMLSDSKNLLDLGLGAIDKLDYMLPDFRNWAKNIYSSHYKIIDFGKIGQTLSKDEALKLELVGPDHDKICFEDFLLSCCPNSILREMAVKSEVVSNDILYGDGRAFDVIIALLKASPDVRKKFSVQTLEYALMVDVFVHVFTAPRFEYLEQVDNFTLSIMANVDGTRRVQKSALKKITTLLRTLSETVREYPRGHLFIIEGQKVPPSAKSMLLSVHAAMITQLRKISRNL